MANAEKLVAAYDNALLGILQNEGKLEAFLDVMFGFLCRRTDFFLTMTSDQQKYGFPPGVAEKMVSTYFMKYQNMVKEAEKEKEEKIKSAQLSKSEKKAKDENVDAKPTKECSVEEDEAMLQSSAENSKLDNESETKATDEGTCSSSSSENINSDAQNQNNQEVFQSNPDSYNGAIRDKYCWSQNYDDVDVKIPVATTVLGAKQVVVEIQRKHLKVLVKNSNKGEGQFETIIDDDLQYEVNREESMWSLERGKHITITLTKDRNVWWSMLVTSEKEIDIQKISAERPMADMDEEEKAVIDKLQFDDRQKKLGLPQSHELKVHEMLKKGWDAEGSPFKGQDFDPKLFNISPGAVNM